MKKIWRKFWHVIWLIALPAVYFFWPFEWSKETCECDLPGMEDEK